MAKFCIIALLLAAQSMSCSGAFVRVKSQAETSFRVQSNSSHASLWNNAFTNRIQHEIAMQAEPVKVNKIFWVILTMFFGCCGCDRCFMGQTLLGVCKGLTLGGFLIWWLVDYWVCVVHAVQKSEKIDMVGYHHVFEKNSIEGAFYTALILLAYQLFQQVAQGRAAKAQMEMQQEQQAALIAAMNTDASQKKDEDASLDIPKRHQSLAFLPTRLTAGLRKAGMVTEKPTVPELIALFAQMDKDGDGQLDHDEIKAGLTAMGTSDEMVDEMIKSADTDGDGKISKNEWLINMSKKEEEK